MDCSNITKNANKLVRTYDTRNPFKLAKYLGIEVRFKKMQKMKGFYTTILKNKYIVINMDLDKIGSKTVCAHEVGHNRFHRNLGIKTFKDEMCISLEKSKPEIEANCFAAEFLIDDKEFLELASAGYTYSQIASMLAVYKELAISKAQLLNTRGYNLKIPYIPRANFLGKV